MVLCSQNLPVPQDRRVWREARSLAAAGFAVTVVSPRGARQPRREVVDHVEVVRYRPAPVFRGVAGLAVETLWALVAVTVAVAMLRRRGRIDVLHAANPPDTFFLVALLLRPLGCRFVYDQHDLCPELLTARRQGAPGRADPLLRRVLLTLERLSYATAALVIAPNGSYRQVALSRGRRRPDRVIVVRSGPDQVAAATPSDDGPLVIAYAGVMGAQDRVDILLEAAAVVLRRRPGVLRVDLIGDGDAVPALRETVDRLGISDAVSWAGWLTGPALPARLGAAAVGVSLDGDDEFSRLSTMTKVPEYLALGLACVIADLPENRVTAGPAARYFRPGDSSSLAAVLDELVDDRGAVECLAADGRERARRLVWDYSAARLVGAYRWLLDDANPVDGDQVIE